MNDSSKRNLLRVTEAGQKANEPMGEEMERVRAQLARAEEALRSSEQRYAELLHREQAARSETEAALKRLAESEQRYRYMGETIPFGVWWCNPRGEAEYVSPSFCELLNMTLEEQQKFGWTQRLVPEDVEPMMKKWIHCCDTGTPWEHEHRIIDRHGKIHTVLSRGLPVRGEDGTIIAWVGVNLDLTARKQMELDLQEAKEAAEEANKAKDQLFATISHELRTPLTLILGPVQKCLASAHLSEEERHDLDVVERNARTLLKHVNDLLDLSKLQVGKMEASYAQVDMAWLTRMVASLFECVAAERQISFAVETPPELSAQGDPDKLQRVLLNLLSNAFKFTPEGGKVEVRLSEQEGKMALNVEDSGPGIPAEHREIVFERFRQLDGGAARRFGGTGLGLAIVKEFVLLHGGRVQVGDAPEGGALFTVEMPLKASPGVPVRPDAQELDSELRRQAVDELLHRKHWMQADTGGATSNSPLVLVVEDNPDMNSFITGRLSREYRTGSAANGREGLAKALDLRPDIIVSDVMMPEMSGDQMVKEIRQCPELDTTPILLLTAKADEPLLLHLLKDWVQDYLCKPFSVEALQARVSRLVRERRTHEAKMRETYSLLRAITDNVPSVVFVKDQGGRYLFINPAGARLFNRPVVEIIGRSDKELIDIETCIRIQKDDQRIMEQQQWLSYEETVNHQGTSRVYLTSKGPRFDAQGKVVGVIGLAQDITERKRAEEALQEANKELQAGKELLESRVTERTAQLRALAAKLTRAEENERRRVAYVLHEGLQQILVGAQYSLVSLNTRSQDPEVQHGLHQIRDMLSESIELSRSLTYELSPPILSMGDMGAILRWLSRWFHEKHGLTVQVEIEPLQPVETPWEEIRGALFRSVLELLFNVVKHAQVKSARIHLSRTHQGWVQIEVSDGGIGFDPEQVRRQVEAGRGFGLFHLRERLEMLGGSLEVESAPGRGSRFTILAPLQQPSSSKAPVSAPSAMGTDKSLESRKIRILLADDHTTVRNGLSRILHDEPDLEVVGQAADGLQAVDQARRLLPDVVLMDITMPNLDGIEATRLVSSELPKVKVIGLTMHEDEAHRVAMHQAGAIDFLTKTDSHDKLLAAIRIHGRS